MIGVRLCALFAALVLCCHAAHTNNWAVLVSTSRFWFNYRHMSNTLSLYRTVKRLGIPDSQIILMLADDIACNPRNVFPGSIFNNANRELDLYGENIEVDYRGYEVTVENFIRLLTNRWSPHHPASKKLLSDENSNILIYMAGHGGNEFLKFQDAEEISAFDIADALAQMHEKKRYNEILFMIDTCQANTMYSKFYSPNILATGSSALDESSYSHHADTDVGVAVIDRYTYHHLEYMEKYVRDGNSNATLAEQFTYVDYAKCHSTPGVRTDLFHRDLREVKITDFFGGVSAVDLDRGNSVLFNASTFQASSSSRSSQQSKGTGSDIGGNYSPQAKFEETRSSQRRQPTEAAFTTFEKKAYGPFAMLITFVAVYIGVKQL